MTALCTVITTGMQIKQSPDRYEELLWYKINFNVRNVAYLVQLVQHDSGFNVKFRCVTGHLKFQTQRVASTHNKTKCDQIFFFDTNSGNIVKKIKLERNKKCYPQIPNFWHLNVSEIPRLQSISKSLKCLSVSPTYLECITDWQYCYHEMSLCRACYVPENCCIK